MNNVPKVDAQRRGMYYHKSTSQSYNVPTCALRCACDKADYAYSGSKLACGLHACLRKCHKLQDHSTVKCHQLVSDECPKKHKLSWKCFALRPASCRTCDAEAQLVAQRQQRDLELEQKRQALQDAYAQKLAAIEVEIDVHRQSMRDRQEAHERENVLRQRQKDLQDVRARTAQQTHVEAKLQQPPYRGTRETEPDVGTRQPLAAVATGDRRTAQDNKGATSSPNSDDITSGCMEDSCPPTSEACAEWEYQKKMEGASNQPLDTLMDMIGLENVKEEFLDLKSTVDLALRQNTGVKTERFGTALLGNPGTGMHTKAMAFVLFRAPSC